MLLLNRKRNEKILALVPPSTTETWVEVEVIEVHNRIVRLGVKAPRHVVIHREEIWAAIQNEIKKNEARDASGE